MALAEYPYKIELHVHLDGAIRTDTILDVGRANGFFPQEETLDDVKSRSTIKERKTLKDILNSFQFFMPAFAGNKEGIRRIAYEFCEDCAKENIKYVEVRYCPHLFSDSIENPEYARSKGSLTPREVVQIVSDGLFDGAKYFGIQVKTILCCMTNRPEWSLEIADLCIEFKDKGVVAIDAAGPDFEPGKDTSDCKIKQAFLKCYEAGIHRTCHAGENGPPEGVQEALDHMFAERIGHGYSVMKLPELYKRCLKDQVHFEVCPISSVRTGSVPAEPTNHPLHRFAQDGANFSINTDDPFVLDNSLSEDYEMVHEMGIMRQDVIKSLFNAARSSFCSHEEKAILLKELQEVYQISY